MQEVPSELRASALGVASLSLWLFLHCLCATATQVLRLSTPPPQGSASNDIITIDTMAISCG